MTPKRLRACGLPRGSNMRIRLLAGVGRFTELFEADSRLDVIAQVRLAGFDIAGQHRADAFAQQAFREGGVARPAALHQLLEAFRQGQIRHHYFPRGRRRL